MSHENLKLCWLEIFGDAITIEDGVLADIAEAVIKDDGRLAAVAAERDDLKTGLELSHDSEMSLREQLAQAIAECDALREAVRKRDELLSECARDGSLGDGPGCDCDLCIRGRTNWIKEKLQ